LLNPATVLGLCIFASLSNPAWKGPEAESAAQATRAVVYNKTRADSMWLRWWAMAPLESSFKVRRYCKTVGQRTDYHGAHYNLLAHQAATQGLIQWPKEQSWSTFKRSREWDGFKDHLKWHPDEGDALAFSAFVELVDRYGLDVATAGWKVDPEEYLKGQSLLDSTRVPGRTSFQRSERRSVEAAWNGSQYLHQVKKQELRLRSCMEKARKQVLREPRQE